MAAVTAAELAGVLTYRDGAEYALGAAWLLAWPYGRPRLMSSYYFEDFDAGPPTEPVHGAEGRLACGDGASWVCEHRWAAIGGMVRWRAVAASAPVQLWQEDGDGRVAFSRGGRAFVALAAPGGGVWKASLLTGLPAGIYCDVAAGAGGLGPPDAPCASNVTVANDGRADVAVGAFGAPVVALHVRAMHTQKSE